MATQDDDFLTGEVPDADSEPTPSELAHARRFSQLIDKTLAGRTPPAMSTDDRALLEVATAIRATHGHLELAPSLRRSIVEDALRQAVGAVPASRAAAPPPRRVRRWTPWLVAGASTVVAMAAGLLLWLRPVHGPSPVARARPAELPEEQRSRSADALVGPIAHEHAGDAGARIDAIFADRLDGFRTRRLARGGTR